MQARTGFGAVLVTLLLACVPSSAAALTFVQATGSPYPTTNPPFIPSSAGFLGGVASGDFNGDGISDLAVVNATGLPVFSAGESVTVLLGSRSGGLTMAPGSPIEIYSGGLFSSTGAIVTGAFTGDRKLDLAVVNEINHTVSILLGNGTGGFQSSGTPIPFSGSETASIAVGDFNGDGKQDLAVITNQLNVFLGNGSGAFTPAPGSPLPLSGFPTSVVAGDFTGNGRSDLAVANGSGYVTVYLSSEAGSFHAAPGSPLTTNAYPTAIAAADLTGDGKLDLVTANALSDNVTVLMDDGSGGFTPSSGSPFPVPAGPNCMPNSAPGLPESIAVGDFDANGIPDLAVANSNGCSDSVAILQGDGGGQFTNASGSPFAANGNPRGLAVGDFNGDGQPDLAVVNPFLGAVTVLQSTTSEPPGQSPGQTAPTGNSGAPQPSNDRPGVPLISGVREKKTAKCSGVVIHVHHDRRTKTHIKKCSARHVSAAHKGDGSASRRRLSSHGARDRA
jgi:hypothetical protein